ncbi:MAG TPA: pyridoxal-phosphate dependent enzyme [Candidatus Acidoferrales bacterium]|nr:pyridoxal-phosphate dependent enzyme [Candidatus Acidoferrales bacterium]
MYYECPPRLVPDTLDNRRSGLWRYIDVLPVDDGQALSLGEGATPLLPCDRLGAAVRLPQLMAKIESQNPTGSFKDRLAAVAVSWALARGYPGIVVSSSGNAGASAAAYAAKAGLPCIVFATRNTPIAMKRFLSAFGAMIVTTETARGRWSLSRQVVQEWGWLPLSNASDPPVGSHPAGIEGYKTIAYELAEALGWRAPDAVVVPVAYGDSLSGMYLGFKELADAGLVQAIPRLIAVEAYPSLSLALAKGKPAPEYVEGQGSHAYSIATNIGTFQALRAIRFSGGTAVTISDGGALEAQSSLRRDEGLLVELSSAMAFAGVRALAASGDLCADDVVVMLLTSSGLKDMNLTLSGDRLPLVDHSLRSLVAVLKRRYGFVA